MIYVVFGLLALHAAALIVAFCALLAVERAHD